jgi:putative ABC transport system permease protein
VTGWRFVVRSLLYHRRTNASVALGVAAATAVLTGALLVGDSVRHSLRQLTLDRLGRIDEVLVTDRFFRTELAAELAASPQFAQHFTAAIPVVLFPRVTVEKAGQPPVARAAQVTVIGCEPAFWDAGEAEHRPDVLPRSDQIVLNAALAADLDARVGDTVVLRLPKSNQVPADSPLGRKTDRIRSVAGLQVVAIVPAAGLGRFSLQASQATPRNAYLATATLQQALGQAGRVNAILVTGRSLATAPSLEAEAALAAVLRPHLEDYGLRLRRVRRTFRAGAAGREDVIYDYFDLTTDRLLFEPAAREAIEQALAGEPAQAVFTYVATSIANVTAEEPSSVAIPYSLITAVDSCPPLGPLTARAGAVGTKLAADEIALNSWAASDLQAVLGDRIRVTFFEPETTHGELRERSAEFTLRQITPLTEPAAPYRRNRPARFEQRPELTNDPDLTPEVEGLTDQDSISDWDAPFPVDSRRVRRQDDEYWQNHRTTPKAFIPLAAGRQLWGSRFGDTTSFRLPVPPDLPPGSPAEQQFRQRIETRLLEQVGRRRAQLGFTFLPVKARGLAASAGTTPFDVLFLFLSFFVIVAALLLVALLFRLGVERRAEEVGTLLAVGLGRRRIGRWLMAEGSGVAAVGSLLGVAGGVAYAWLMLAGLRTWWFGAVQTSALRLYIQQEHRVPVSLLVGYVSGVMVSAATIALSLRGLRRVSVRRLLAGEATVESDRSCSRRRSSKLWWVVLLLLLAAMGLAVGAAHWGGEAQAGAFVGSGTLLLVALLLTIRTRLRSPNAFGRQPASLGLPTLAVRNAGRNPGRSTATIGLMAVACFLIVALSAFRLEPSVRGTGGFDLIAESSEPIFADLNQAETRRDLLADDADKLADCAVIRFRVQPGDDASCNNLYKPAQPRVLGVTPELIRRFDQPGVPSFSWSASAAVTPEEQANPWRLLAGDEVADDKSVPVVLDANTAMYSLQLYRGIGEEFAVTYPDGRTTRFRVAGLLSNSILQGSLLISQRDFVRLYPDVSGYRFFLIATPSRVAADQVSALLEDKLSDQGFDAVSAYGRLADLLAVQNTYLSTFQSLGALGLLLGTFGLAAVQARNVLERRRELALLRAVGFRRRRLAALVLLENTGLLVGGLLTGAFAALVAVLPHMWLGGAAVPWRDLTIMLAAVLVVGVLASLATVRTTLHAPVLPALRGE